MRFTLVLLLAVSLPVAAQQNHNHHNHMSMSGMGNGANAQSNMMQPGQLTVGLVKKIDLKSQELMIQHGPLDSIGMPAMTMSFGVTDASWLKKLQVGDKINFSAEMGKNGTPVMNHYERAN